MPDQERVKLVLNLACCGGGLVLLVGLAVGLVLYFRRSISHRQELIDWAGSTGLTYEPSGDSGVRLAFSGQPFRPASRGDVRADHVMTGSWRGHRGQVFELARHVSYGSVQGGATSTERYQVTVLFTPPARSWVEIWAHPHPKVDPAGFPSLPLGYQFAAYFAVRTDDQTLTRDLFTPPLMTWMLNELLPALGRGPSRTLTIRLQRAGLVAWQPGRLDPRMVHATLDLLATMAAHIPPATWR